MWGFGRHAAFVAPAPRPASSSWESGSPRYIFAGDGGIWTAGLRGGVRLTEPVMLDSRGVTDANAVVDATTLDGGRRLMAVAGGDLLEVASNRVRTLRRGVGSCQPAWMPVNAELCLVEPGAAGGAVAVLSTATGQWLSRTLPKVTHVFNASGHSRLTAPGYGYLTLDSELRADMRCVVTFEPEVPERHPMRGTMRLAEVVADIRSAAADGTIDIAVSEGRGVPEVMSRVAFAGALNAPVSHVAILPVRYRVALTIDGLFSPDTLIYTPSVRFVEHKP